MKQSFWQKISPMKLILGGYCLIIFIGAMLLALPVSTKEAGGTSFSDCLFTATSATCVTGLIRFDTVTHWTLFGQIVIITMIQIGGVGFMTVAIMMLLLARKRISMNQRLLMQDSISAPQIGGIVPMTKFVAFGTLTAEGIGALLLSVDFIPRFGWKKGIYYAVFHSISTFCNAGFDLMGETTGPCSSMTGMVDNWYVNIVLMLLIIVSSLGFFVWYDIGRKRFRFRDFQLQSKIVLSVSAFLVVFGAIGFFVLERERGMLEGLSLPTQILASAFQSVTARTAGFNTVDYAKMTDNGIVWMVGLMLVGGSTGSTAGGMKTTTFYVLCASVFATFGRRKNIEAFGRRMDESVTRMASCIFVSYLSLSVGAAVVISFLEKLPFLPVLFETVSAMATVGLTVGLTPSLSMASKIILICLMICGRVGSVTVLMAFSSEKKAVNSRYPMEQIQIG